MKIYTHDGTFHADDAMACAIIRLAHRVKPKIVRSRSDAVMKFVEKGDFVVDVGGVYDEDNRRFDHHQASFNQTHTPTWLKREIRYASAGLIWCSLGVRLVRKVIGSDAKDDLVFEIVNAVSDDLISRIDAHDNGEATFGFSLEVSQINRAWVEPEEVNNDDRFDDAVRYCEIRLLACICTAWGRSNVLSNKTIQDAEWIERGRVVILDRYSDWSSNQRIYGTGAKFVVYPDHKGQWAASAVPLSAEYKDKFTKRCPFPQDWAGLFGPELVLKTGVVDARFCHRERFYATARTREGVVELCRKAMEIEEGVPAGPVLAGTK